MKRMLLVVCLVLLLGEINAAPPQITIYNSGFAVVREMIPLDLHKGTNDVLCPPVSPFLDPASVMLRDPSGKADFRIILQKFRDDALTEPAMLARLEGETIPFRVNEEGKQREVMGKILRAGYWRRSSGSVDLTSEPIIEIEGRYTFGLPGTAIFSRLPDGEILKPELRWKIAAPEVVKTDAELVYLTDGLSWQADYNAIVAEDGKISQLLGWITLENNTGRRFEDTHLKLVAGNVKRVRGGLHRSGVFEPENVIVTGSNAAASEISQPAVERRTFDEFHEYTVPMPVSLDDREMTQVELVRASNVAATRSFIYDGSNLQINDLPFDYARLDSGFGTDSNSKVAIISEFTNNAANHLGVPLPEGQVHFYRTDAEGLLQFSGDSKIENTPQDEMVRATTGYAFDVVGERRQTDFRVNETEHTADESFEITVRNHRKNPITVRVWEHPCRWRQWELAAQSQPSKKIDQKTFEFSASVAPNEEKKVTYTIRYTKLPGRP